jgi:hypothetical protein
MFVYPTTYNGDGTTARQAPPVTIGSGDARTGVDVHLRAVPTWRVSGRLMGPEGSVAHQALRLFPTSLAEDRSTESGLETASALTDQSGSFTFLGVPSGSYVLRSNKYADMRTTGQTTSLTDAFWLVEPVIVGNQDTTITATWRAAFTMSGRVVFDGGTAVPAADRLLRIPLLVESVDQTQVPGTSRPAQITNNMFTTPQVPAGRYLIRVGSAPPGWALRSVMYEGRDISDAGVDVRGPVSDIVMTFTDRITTLSGTVQSATGVAATDATALLFPADPAGWQDFGLNPRRLKSARVDDSGKYNFPDVPAGDYFVVAVPEEQAAVWREPGRLAVLSRLATRVHLIEGQSATQDLRAVIVR